MSREDTGAPPSRHVKDWRQHLKADLPVVFFPEGTTSNGSGMLKFHSGLLSQVRVAGAAVTPGHICYRLGEGNGDATVGDDVCYWGDNVTLLPHIFRLLGLRGIRAEVRFEEEPIVFSVDPEQRKRAAQEAWVAVAELAQLQSGTETVHNF